MDNHNSADLEEIRKPKNATKDERGLPQSIDNDATEREVEEQADEIKSEPDDPHRHHKDEPCSRTAAKGMSANDRKMRSSLKRLSLSNIPEMEEVEMTKEDGTAIHSNNPKLDDSLDANTAAVNELAEGTSPVRRVRRSTDSNDNWYNLYRNVDVQTEKLDSDSEEIENTTKKQEHVSFELPNISGGMVQVPSGCKTLNSDGERVCPLAATAPEKILANHPEFKATGQVCDAAALPASGLGGDDYVCEQNFVKVRCNSCGQEGQVPGACVLKRS